MSKTHCIELITESVDLNTDVNPQACYLLTCADYPKFIDHIKKADIKFTAIIANCINPIIEKICVKVENGSFCFNIPAFTVGLEVTVKVLNSCKTFVKLISYSPATCKSDFVADRLSLRLMIKMCNQMAIDTSGLDHTPVAPGEHRIYGQQLGPCRASRAMAIIHIAMFEALIAIMGGYQSYVNLPPASKTASVEAAIAQAAYTSTVWLYSSHQPRLAILLANQLAQIPDGLSKIEGINVGNLAAQAIINLRTNDNSNIPDGVIGVNYFPGDQPGVWRSDPVSPSNKAYGAFWNEVIPFVLTSADIYRAPPPPLLPSVDYMMAFDDVKSIGGDEIHTITMRSEEQTFIGNFWAYDGVPELCAPVRFYNQIAIQIANQHGMNTIDLMYMLAMVNVCLGDCAISCWDSKYFYCFWRPCSGIRQADVGTGPTGDGDGNPGTSGDVDFYCLGAPGSNIPGNDRFTPPFPSYTSGHATFGAGLFQILRYIYGTDNIQFTIVSDEYNGITKDPSGNVRPYRPRTFNNFSQAEEENGESRIYLGIHFGFDKVYGIQSGRQVADYVYSHIYQKI